MERKSRKEESQRKKERREGRRVRCKERERVGWRKSGNGGMEKKK